MTGKEAAQIDELASGGREKIRGFLVTASARNIQEYIHEKSASPDSHMYQRARTALNIRLAEDAEIISKRLYKLTWALLAITAVLLVFTIALYRDLPQAAQSV